MPDKIAIKQQSAVAQKARKNPAIDMPLREKVLCQNTRKASVPTLISMDLGNELISKDDLTKSEKYVNERTQSMNEISLQGRIPGIGNERNPSLPNISQDKQVPLYKRLKSVTLRDPSLPCHFDLSSWLLEGNVSEKNMSCFKKGSIHGGVSTVGIAEVGKGRILRFDQMNIRNHIKKWLKDKVRLRYLGIKNLKEATRNGQLREGQMIFEEVTIPHQVDAYSNWKGSFYDAFETVVDSFTKMIPSFSKEGPKFTYFRVSVYVGQYGKDHYVVDNDCHAGLGMVKLCTMEKAFGKTSTFFVVSPPKGENGKTTRYITIQRALSSVGTKYKYHIKAACCEQFGLIMAGLFQESKIIQDEACRSVKKRGSVADLLKRIDYRDFHESMMQNILKVRRGIILTLDFALNHYLEPAHVYCEKAEDGSRLQCRRKSSILDLSQCTKHVEQITSTYEELMDAILAGNTDAVIALVNQGLHLNSVTSYGKTALTLAASKGLTSICRALLLEVSENYRAKLGHRDEHELTAIEYAISYKHHETEKFLVEMYENVKDVPLVEKK